MIRIQLRQENVSSWWTGSIQRIALNTPPFNLNGANWDNLKDAQEIVISDSEIHIEVTYPLSEPFLFPFMFTGE